MGLNCWSTFKGNIYLKGNILFLGRLKTCVLVALQFMSSLTLYSVHHLLKQVQGFVNLQFVSLFAYRTTWVMCSDVRSWLLEKCVICIGIQLVTHCWNIAPWCGWLHKPNFKGENGSAALFRSTALVMVLLLGYKILIKRPFHSKQTNCMPFFLRHCYSSNNESLPTAVINHASAAPTASAARWCNQKLEGVINGAAEGARCWTFKLQSHIADHVFPATHTWSGTPHA